MVPVSDTILSTEALMHIFESLVVVLLTLIWLGVWKVSAELDRIHALLREGGGMTRTLEEILAVLSRQ